RPSPCQPGRGPDSAPCLEGSAVRRAWVSPPRRNGAGGPALSAFSSRQLVRRGDFPTSPLKVKPGFVGFFTKFSHVHKPNKIMSYAKNNAIGAATELFDCISPII